jgi:hypothetical protein
MAAAPPVPRSSPLFPAALSTAAVVEQIPGEAVPAPAVRFRSAPSLTFIEQQHRHRAGDTASHTDAHRRHRRDRHSSRHHTDHPSKRATESDRPSHHRHRHPSDDADGADHHQHRHRHHRHRHRDDDDDNDDDNTIAAHDRHRHRSSEQQRTEPPATTGGGDRRAAQAAATAAGSVWTDPRGDLQNLEFGSLYSGHVPRFRRVVRRTVLGLRAGESAAWSDDYGAVRARGPVDARWWDDGGTGSARLLAQQRRYHALLVQSAAPPAWRMPPSSAVRAVSVHARGLAVGEAADDNFVPVPDDLALVNRGAVPAGDPRLAVEEDAAVLETREATRRLNEHLNAHPRDVDAWLQLVRHQDACIPPGTRRRAALLAESKCAVLDRALHANPLSDKLALVRLALLAETKDRASVEQMWQELLFRRPAAPALWLAYLEFACSDFAAFSLPTFLRACAKCLRIFSAVRDGLIAGAWLSE